MFKRNKRDLILIIIQLRVESIKLIYKLKSVQHKLKYHPVHSVFSVFCGGDYNCGIRFWVIVCWGCLNVIGKIWASFPFGCKFNLIFLLFSIFEKIHQQKYRKMYYIRTWTECIYISFYFWWKSLEFSFTFCSLKSFARYV